MTIDINNKRVHNLLIIDDEIDIIKALERLFRRKYNVFSTTSPQEALRIMEREEIQVVISDQRMPGMTGVDFFTRIKDMYPDTMKLILTGYTDIESVIGAINKGQVFRYVKKPWDPNDLDMIVREAFEKSELMADNRMLMNELSLMNLTLEEKVKNRTVELELLNQRLKEINQEKNRYIGMVAHDLRNPIGVAAVYSDLLLDEYDSTPREDQLQYIGQINESCYFSLDLIREFLDASKIEAGIFDLRIERKDYIKFVKDVIHQNEHFARIKSQKIRLESSLENIEACFDTNKMQQVLNNLLSNAMKYSQPNTEINVSVSMDGKTVVTHVTDQGLGIPKEEFSKIYQPFQTTSVKSTGNEKSFGLGLALVKKIVEAHVGKVWFESEVNKGSIFSFSLPQCPEKSE
ncbi:MAG: ATP-binding protein, partial [Bacteroidales bacterium]